MVGLSKHGKVKLSFGNKRSVSAKQLTKTMLTKVGCTLRNVGEKAENNRLLLSGLS